MLITDLKQPCKSCGCSGFEAGYDENGSLHARLRQDCSYCRGKGYVLTDMGQEVWKLLKPMILDLIREEKYHLGNPKSLQGKAKSTII